LWQVSIEFQPQNWKGVVCHKFPGFFELFTKISRTKPFFGENFITHFNTVFCSGAIFRQFSTVCFYKHVEPTLNISGDGQETEMNK
jgi:hypothetical protein